MKVLFIPTPEGVVSHIIPLMALEEKLDKNRYETAFLLPGDCHPLAREINMNLVEVDHQRGRDGFRSELIAYGKFNPDVVVDDASLSTLFAAQLTKKPRVAVQRTGMFNGDERRYNSKGHVHSLGKIVRFKDLEVVGELGLPVPRTFTDLFASKMKVVAGTPTLEVLPEIARNDPTYVFSGHLLIEDLLVERVNRYYQQRRAENVLYKISDLETFFNINRNKNRLIVYFTFGNVARATGPVFEAIRYMLDNNTAVITNINIGEVESEKKELYFYSSFLPPHYVCNRVRLMIHHGGAGTYQYQVLYELPAITIGTRCYDREELALRLQQLEVSRHIPAPGEVEDFVSLFKNAFESVAELTGSLYQRAKVNLKALNEESQRVKDTFDFGAVLEQAVRMQD